MPRTATPGLCLGARRSARSECAHASHARARPPCSRRRPSGTRRPSRSSGGDTLVLQICKPLQATCALPNRLSTPPDRWNQGKQLLVQNGREGHFGGLKGSVIYRGVWIWEAGRRELLKVRPSDGRGGASVTKRNMFRWKVRILSVEAGRRGSENPFSPRPSPRGFRAPRPPPISSAPDFRGGVLFPGGGNDRSCMFSRITAGDAQPAPRGQRAHRCASLRAHAGATSRRLRQTPEVLLSGDRPGFLLLGSERPGSRVAPEPSVSLWTRRDGLSLAQTRP